jgi:demethylmenaquinone methyltransferase/2-methoxy-6-polyprenyl-1,4-benzoquinol methylase
MADPIPSPDARHPDPDKAERVRRMFAAIHGHYDRINRLMTLGWDLAWRRAALREAALPPGGSLLDVAQERLARAGLGGRFALVQGDALALPFPDGAFDAVVSAFMMRNVADVPRAFEEQARVVRPGGRVVCLELAWPRAPFFRVLFALYFRHLIPWLGGLLSGHPEAYRYLPESVAAFFTREEMLAFMEGAGLARARCRTLAGGTVAIYVAERA